MMNILIVSAMTPGSKTGVTAHYNRLIERLTDRGASVTLLTSDDAPWLVNKFLSGLGKLSKALGRLNPTLGDHAWILFLEFSRFVSLWLAVRLRGRDRYDLVHAQDVNTGAATALALRHQTPTIATCHFNDDPVTEYVTHFRLSPWLKTQLRRWFLYLFGQHDAFITVSDYIRQTSAFLRPAGADCAVISNGVDFPQPAPKQPTDTLTIINVGTLEDRKNQRLLIEAAHCLRAGGFTNFRVWFMGDGPKRAEWQRLIDERGLTNQVTFEGFRPDVPAYLNRADLYVHTATNESWGYAITEAIASGTPVLALATGGIPEQFGDGKPGLLPITTSAEGLAAAIRSCADPEKRARLAAEQHRYAREQFSLDAMIDKHLRFYERVLARRTTAGPVAEAPVKPVVNV